MMLDRFASLLIVSRKASAVVVDDRVNKLDSSPASSRIP